MADLDVHDEGLDGAYRHLRAAAEATVLGDATPSGALGTPSVAAAFEDLDELLRGAGIEVAEVVAGLATAMSGIQARFAEEDRLLGQAAG
ncbi:hypothetical protein [Paraoerskovia marina]|uniref:hypothetical protein n=1 Tax=Paraoerskovia marina TaxID=545619 RepID=UPI00138E5214|nr:hypothetical protein [Paraoerskovia marina]